MSQIQQSQFQNRILSRLPHEDFALLKDHMEFMDCPYNSTLCAPDEPFLFMLFPETGVISIVVQSAEGQLAESGVVGREGFIPSSIMLGTDQTPHRIEVQIAGRGYKVEIAAFLAVLSKSEILRDTLLKFTQSLLIQTSYTAMSNAVHTIEERLARWLLMCHDRMDSDDLRLTHKFMSVMLAVRRASVTNALQTLEAKHLITAERGYVMIRNRAGLESFAGDAYGVPEAEYRRLLGPL